ncbi:hypothetical protein BT96DRAFT_820148 [Gymnopus androsaceus JB14]|uniref:MYND-type domain-containing protein n=1 Tax=Gymnopus androsaceus JB14 TaxID=1447944 RepID=A0A6A4HRU4_9AGAR|nr:hypothetical protein BT96DRAFT_820148 [Gymnopus androsaceus JB14]
MASNQIPVPPSLHECEYIDCPLWDEGGEADEIRRCAVCKYQHYCSQSCQKQDWKKHKFACSSLTIDQEKAFLIPDEDELRVLTDMMVRWEDAYRFSKKASWNVSVMPESQELLGLNIPSGSSYHLLPADQASRPFRLPLILICRRFLSEMLRPLTDEARKILEDYVTICGQNPPSPYSKVYGPKIMWKPADVSTEEYNFWMTIAPIVASQDYKVCQFPEWTERWRALATCRVFLWDDDNVR